MIVSQTISDTDFKRFSRLVYDKTGINLHMGKKQLLQSRVSKVLRKRNIESYKAYYDIIVADKTEQELIDFINLISTNVTYFYRETKHFSYLRDVWSQEPHSTVVEVWSAACSTGEEPYTLAIELSEILGGPTRFHMLGSDISTRVLDIAKKGIYALDKIEKVPPDLVRKYFQKGTGSAQGYARVKSSLRERIEYRKVNLIEELPMRTMYDLIVCRNVMIYFDIPVKNGIIKRLQDRLRPGGTLFIGHSESLNGLNHQLKYVAPAIYRKPE